MSHHILLVDDDELVVRAIARALKMAGYTISTAADGADALEVLEAEDIDVVLSDVWMPVMDGFTLLDRVKERLPSMPVVLFSGLHFQHREQEVIARGAAALLAKPLDARTLVRVLEDIMGSPPPRG